jgi:hypothetical protein
MHQNDGRSGHYNDGGAGSKQRGEEGVWSSGGGAEVGERGKAQRQPRQKQGNGKEQKQEGSDGHEGRRVRSVVFLNLGVVFLALLLFVLERRVLAVFQDQVKDAPANASARAAPQLMSGRTGFEEE